MTVKPKRKPEKENNYVTKLELVHSDKRLLLPEGTESPVPKPVFQPPDKDWLTPLAIGTEFACVFSGDSRPVCDVYTVNDKGEPTIELFTDLNDPEMYIRVVPSRFCMFYDLVEILHEPEQEEQPNSDGTTPATE